MAKSKVVHSDDACTIIFKGDIKDPEPSTGVIKFPGGLVEVSRTSDGKYWAHIYADDAANIVHSRVDYNFEEWVKTGGDVPEIPRQESIKKIAIKISVAD